MAHRQNSVAGLTSALADRKKVRRWKRTVLVGLGELSFLALVLGLFWYQEWQYSLPTPMPSSLYQPDVGSMISLPADCPVLAGANRAVLLHFFNPNCPCSRFNLEHVRSLHRMYGDRIDVVAVIEGGDSEQLQQQVDSLRLPFPAILDTDQSLANLVGVYSTPQAAILDNRQRLHFRGNYNVSRYCTAPQTEFARLALESLLSEESVLVPKSAAATTAYGCSLPSVCRQEESL